MPNLGLAFDDTARLIIDQSEILNNTGEVWQQQLTVADPTKPVRIVMTYTDEAGLVGTSPQVNDLNLTVANNGKQYRGNHFSGQWSIEGGNGDIANNYEAIFLPANTSGQIDLTITAVQIAGNGVPNFGDETDQDFALVCYNCAVAPDFHLTINPQDIAICQTEKQTNLTIDIASIAGFSEEVALSLNNVPSGLSANFAPASVTPPQSSQLTLANIASIPSGSYQMFINGISTSRDHQLPLWLHPVATSPAPIRLSKPENGAINVAINPTFTWQADDLATSSYLEIATDAAFTDVIYSASVQGNSHRLTTIGLNVETTYYWRLTTNNACGERVSTIRQFTTKETWPILLVDDDWGSLYHPILDLNVEGKYLSALGQIGTYFDYWNVEATGTEPDTAVLDQYDAVIWFSGDAYKVFLTPIAGPSATSEPILQSYLNNEHCLLLSSQEYYYDRGLTTFMQEYLGVAQVQDDVSQTSVTGVGDIFGNLGTHPLDGVASTGTADPDILIPNELGQVGFIGSSNDAIGIYKETEMYKTTYLAFDLADVDHDPMVTILEDFLHWCQGENNLSADSEFIYLPMVIKR